MAALDRAVNIGDLRRLGRARLPAVVFDYLDGGADREWTLRDNVRAFRRWQLHNHRNQRCLFQCEQFRTHRCDQFSWGNDLSQ